MKTIYLKKGYDFSSNSSVSVVFGATKIDLSEYEYAKIEMIEGQSIKAKQMWCGSKTVQYDEFDNECKYFIKPILNKKFALISLSLFCASIIEHIFFKHDYVRYFIGLIGVYILYWISIGSQKYLKIVKLRK